MIPRIWAVYRAEAAKAIRTKQFFAGPVLMVLAIVGLLLAHPIHRDGASDYGFIAFAMPVALDSIGFVMLLAFCAGLISNELGTGTIRQALVRPIRRHEYLLGKLLLSMTYAAGMVVVASLVCWGLAWRLGELHGVFYGGELVCPAGTMLTSFCLGALLELAPLWAGAAFALLISACTRSGAAAVSAAIGLWVLFDAVKYAAGFEPYVFTTYLEAPWQVFAQRCDAIPANWFPMTGYCLGVCGATMAVCTAGAIAVLQRRSVC